MEARLDRKGRRTMPGWRRGFAWAAWGVLLTGLLLTGALWRQAQGLEQRVLEAIQPHLAKDVRIGSVSLSIRKTWPNVEVVLHQVWIEDALKDGDPFMEMDEIGVVFGWRALLGGRFHAVEARASDGFIAVERQRNGAVNWEFWRAGETNEDGVDWGIDVVRLEGVSTTGNWWAADANEPMVWSGSCRDVGLRVHRDGTDGPWVCEGRIDLEAVDLEASGFQWVTGIELTSSIGLVWSGDGVSVVMEDGLVGTHGTEIPCGVQLSDEGGFAMTLSLGKADVDALSRLLPPHLMVDGIKGSKWSGKAKVDVVVGRVDSKGDWSGPDGNNWSGEWAVRAQVEGAGIRQEDLAVSGLSGAAAVFSVRKGWQVDWNDVKGRSAGGEFMSSGNWIERDGKAVVSLKGEALVRPAGVMVFPVMQGLLPEGLTLQEGGQLGLTLDVDFDEGRDGQWRWSGGSGDARLDAVFLQEKGCEGADCLWEMVDARVDAHPDSWSLSVGELKGPGFDGKLECRDAGQGVWEIDAGLGRLDVPVLEQALMGLDASGNGSRSGFMPDGVHWNVKVDQVEWNALTASVMMAKGEFNPNTGQGRIEEMECGVFGGSVETTGSWDRNAVRFDGRMMDVDVAELLVGTEGMGQTTLLPVHVRGRAWAEGDLTYRFNDLEEMAWETALSVRLEECELIDFDLLQRIPETLEQEGKYRLLADANDLRRRLRRVRFNPVDTRVVLERGVFTVEPTEVVSDAMDVGISGWQSLSGGMDYTLDFALRDLKSNEDEFGVTEDDGLGHRFFLSIGGTLEAPEFGYDRSAHQDHRREERRNAMERLKNLVRGSAGNDSRLDSASAIQGMQVLRTEQGDDSGVSRRAKRPEFVDDKEDFSP